VAFSPDDKVFAIGRQSGGIDLWRWDTGIRERVLRTSETVKGARFFQITVALSHTATETVSRFAFKGLGEEVAIWRASKPAFELEPA